MDKKPNPEPLLIPIAEAAVMLCCSQRTVDRLIADGQLPCVRVGIGLRKRTFLKRSDLERFIRQRTERY